MRDSWVRLSPASSRTGVFVSVRLGPSVPWVCMQVILSLGTCCCICSQWLAKVLLVLESDIISSNSPSSRAARALHSVHTQQELTGCPGPRQVTPGNRVGRACPEADSNCARPDLALARICSRMARDSICRLVALYQYSQKPADFLLLCAASCQGSGRILMIHLWQ